MKIDLVLQLPMCFSMFLSFSLFIKKKKSLYYSLYIVLFYANENAISLIPHATCEY